MKLMLVAAIFFLILQNLDGYWSPDKRQYYSTLNVPKRLLQLMNFVLEDVKMKVADLLMIRTMAEKHPFYEMGYTLAYIIEKYRKMVEQVKRPLKHNADIVPETVVRLEHVQRLYFEIWHLCMMIHEIPNKYGVIVEKFNRVQLQKEREVQKEVVEEMKVQIQKEVLLKKEKKKQQSKVREKYEQHYKDGKLLTSFTTKKRTGWWWPLEYGWEIDRAW